MSYIMVDVEADGPIPGDYSMISIGAVVVRPGLTTTFYGKLKPISHNYDPAALKISGFSRDDTLTFDQPQEVMQKFKEWITKVTMGRPMFISDNNGFDWMFTCWYFHRFIKKNPFGHSSSNLGSLYKGIVKDEFQSFKHLRKTKHSHHPVEDEKGNAEALFTMKEKYGLKISLT